MARGVGFRADAIFAHLVGHGVILGAYPVLHHRLADRVIFGPGLRFPHWPAHLVVFGARLRFPHRPARRVGTFAIAGLRGVTHAIDGLLLADGLVARPIAGDLLLIVDHFLTGLHHGVALLGTAGWRRAAGSPTRPSRAAPTRFRRRGGHRQDQGRRTGQAKQSSHRSLPEIRVRNV